MEEISFEGKTYKVSFDAMPASLKKALSKEALKKYVELLQRVQAAPKKVYKEVKSFAAQHSNVPEIANLLTFAHIQNRQVIKAEKLIESTFHDYPDYLFARINYADQCVRKRKLDAISDLFPTFDLQELCPNKDVFHTSEFRGFLIMMAHYCRACNDREKAIHYYKGAKSVEPHHPGVIYLEKKLFHVSLLKKLLRRFSLHK